MPTPFSYAKIMNNSRKKMIYIMIQYRHEFNQNIKVGNTYNQVAGVLI